MNALRIAILGFLAFSLLVPCFATLASQPASTTPKQEVLRIGAPMPDFTLTDQSGKPWKLSALKGKKAVAITFGFTMCQCGQAALKELQTVQDKYASRGLQVVHVNMEPEALASNPKHLAGFALRHKITYPLLADRNLAVSSRFDLYAMPFLCLVDKDGILRFVLGGHPDGYLDVVTQEVEKVLPPPKVSTVGKQK